jgi:transketolase
MPTGADVAPISASKLAHRIRRHVLQMTHRARSSHVGGGLSVADILAVLYGSVLRVDPPKPDWPGRDRLVFSKGHAAAALYATLAERGFFPVDDLTSFYQDGSRLLGHVTKGAAPGVDCSTGSLGHGLSIACGMALAGKTAAERFRVFAVLSDGECDEGSTWEAALFAPHHRLDNLTVIVDYNKIQSLGHTKNVLDLDPLAAKWNDFGWGAVEVDGHNQAALTSALTRPPTPGKPACIIAHTVKGKGVPFMEDSLLWHYRAPNDDELGRALEALGVEPA